MKARGITQIKLAEMSGIPLQTLRGIFCDKVPNPRIDTMHAIEKALGLNTETIVPTQAKDKKAAPTLSEKERRLIGAFNELIPPMQDYILEMTENLVTTQKKQNGASGNVYRA